MRKMWPAWGRSIQVAVAVAVAVLLIAATVVLVGVLGRDRGASGGEPTGTTPPVVIVRSPAGGERWTGGSTHPVEWQMSDDEDVSLYVEIYARLNPGGNWTRFHAGTYSTGGNLTFPWTVPAVDTEDAAIRVCATDSDGMTGCDESGSFAIDSTRPMILSTYPADAAINVPVDAYLITVFSEGMSPPTVDPAFFIQPPVGGIVFVWSAGDTVLTIPHASPFQSGTLYTWGFTCALRDQSDPGNPLESCPRSFQFLTEGGGGNTSLPDLTLTPADITSSPPDPVYGDQVTLYANVHNVGTADAYNVSVSFYDNAICMLPAIYDIGVDMIPYIPAGGSAVASRVWDTTKSADGRDYIWAEADPSRLIPESDETNNAAYRWIYVRNTPCEGGGNQTGPDLTLTSQDIVFTPTETPDVGQSIWIHAYVHNVGNQDACNVTVRFYDLFNGNRMVIGEGMIPSIPAGWWANATVEWTAGPAGWHTIEVVADPDNAILESNEGNNAASRDILVGAPPPLSLFVQAWTFDNDRDGRYDDVVILVYDGAGHAVAGASVSIDGVFYGLTPDTGLLVLYNFLAGNHSVLATIDQRSAWTSFVSDG